MSRNLGVGTHGHACAGLAILRDIGLQVARAYAAENLQPVTVSLGTVQVQQNFPQAFTYTNRRIRGCIGTTCNTTLNLAESDFVSHKNGRFQTCATGLLNIISRCFRCKPTAKCCFPGQVEVPGVLHNSTCYNLTKALALKVEAVHQTAQGRRQQLLIADLAVNSVRASKRNPVAAKNRDATNAVRALFCGFSRCWFLLVGLLSLCHDAILSLI